MKQLILLITLCFCSVVVFAQEPTTVLGKVINATDGSTMEKVNIVNINQVKGTATNGEGKFEIQAKANDTLYFSYLGFKSIKVRVTNDWLKYGESTIEMTELAFALEEVVINQFNLTGVLEVDIKQVPINNNYRYSISGLPSTGYEAGRSSNAVTRVLGAVFNPADFLYSVFGKEPNEMKKLKKMKQDDEIRNLLANRFDREMLTALLQVDRVDLDEIVRQCNYSKGFIETANDLQILDAISQCYEEYKVLSRTKRSGRL
ncbi:carboxypeptidase-like regulatory domain-containing protein [Mangrovimonas sp. AS39]|uniref:carboxypeptidase-like regulatory domain-containing protein n=1 Tax=Mangrovimonas TaxID=1211036 RepID=UPI0006B58444|nr:MULTISPECIES: carboxypeptidase-like regulatory domain-containing protein [Mangrovimonas]MCF1191166.1 carboxypeptidase-like regulatory domain-containing protein [Mangrovimonas futianensis]MCF1194861.1 carboxypeptidase-like regulatory domain-containing protein [Mangrovimonas futianensis]MCF1421464.1 carboxypeptidase-like regulatory domain-containing protein [Mangrovimonas futianensis]NIK92601.1 carboxypeptidase-like regulatory domain-containing protein [Mangrovimonas sp. CR14]